jgi:hypothetical protein
MCERDRSSCGGLQSRIAGVSASGRLSRVPGGEYGLVLRVQAGECLSKREGASDRPPGESARNGRGRVTDEQSEERRVDSLSGLSMVLYGLERCPCQVRRPRLRRTKPEHWKIALSRGYYWGIIVRKDPPCEEDIAAKARTCASSLNDC